VPSKVSVAPLPLLPIWLRNPRTLILVGRDTLVAGHREETVFLSGALHRTALIYQGASPVEITGRTEGLFIEAIKVLLRICITRTWVDARFDYSNNLGIAFS